MKVTAEKIENQQVKLTIEAEASELEKGITLACKYLANRVNIPGFRKGKAPRMILERHVGKENLLQEAFDQIASKLYQQALDDQKLEPVTRPEIDVVTLEEGKDLVFTAAFTPRPEVTLGEYKGLKSEKKEVSVSDEEVEKMVTRTQEQLASMVDAPEGAVIAEGDFITLDFDGSVDGVPFNGGKGEDYPLQIGSNSFIPGFEDQLIGAKVDEERDVNVTFPEEYHAEELAGKPALFKCKIRSIKQRILPEINDELAKKGSKFETLEEFRADIRKNLEQNMESRLENERQTAIIDQATSNITVEIPEVMVEQRIDSMLREMEIRLQQSGMNFEQYLQYSGMDIEKMREQYREPAIKNIKTDLMLEDVAKAEDIQVTNADLDQEVAMMAIAYGATQKDVRKIIKEQGQVSMLANSVLRKKTARFIIDSAVTE